MFCTLIFLREQQHVISQYTIGLYRTINKQYDLLHGSKVEFQIPYHSGKKAFLRVLWVASNSRLTCKIPCSLVYFLSWYLDLQLIFHSKRLVSIPILLQLIPQQVQRPIQIFRKLFKKKNIHRPTGRPTLLWLMLDLSMLDILVSTNLGEKK